ncbi:MAG: hypothetical protein J0M18_21585 [Ignavibacteria bacterium]|nr:hypothetical protein [Ignavibacteria bacterium]
MNQLQQRAQGDIILEKLDILFFQNQIIIEELTKPEINYNEIFEEIHDKLTELNIQNPFQINWNVTEGLNQFDKQHVRMFLLACLNTNWNHLANEIMKVPDNLILH